MNQIKSVLHPIQQNPEYQLSIRNSSDTAAQGLLTLLVTINVGAFITVIELLQDKHWLLWFFTVSAIAALLARAGIYYIYRYEVSMFDNDGDLETVSKLDGMRMKYWRMTEFVAHASLTSFVLGLLVLTYFFVLG